MILGYCAAFSNFGLRNPAVSATGTGFFNGGSECDSDTRMILGYCAAFSNFDLRNPAVSATGTVFSTGGPERDADIHMFRIWKRIVLQLREQPVDAACDHLNRHDGKNQPHQPCYNVKAALPELGDNRR